ncbi:MAG: hypothetical protein ABIL25_00640 [candidate division WOR-3 bacterium]
MSSLKQWSIIGLVLCPMVLLAGQWYDLENIPGYPLYEGTAMAFGRCNGTPYVWLLHGRNAAPRPPYHGQLHRYNITTATGTGVNAADPHDQG